MSTTIQRVSVNQRAEQISGVLEKKLPEFLKVAPAQLGEKGVQRLIRQASIAVARSENLAKCRPATVCIAVLQAVELGIDLASARPQAWIVPFGDEAKLMLSYNGLADIAYRDGAVKLIQARAVYDKDEFEIDYGNIAKPFTHKPAFSVDGNPGKLIGTYAVAVLPDSPIPAFEWLDILDIEQIHQSSKGKNSDAWKNWYDEMAKKSAVRRLCKLLPTCPPKLGRALEIDYEADGLEEKDDRKPASDRPRNTDRLAEALGTPVPKPKENAPSGSLHVDTSDAQPDPDAYRPITEDDIPF